MRDIRLMCRSCGLEMVPRSEMVKRKLEGNCVCQGCRAAAVLKDRPWLLPLYVDFWKVQGFPESASWMENLNQVQTIN